MTTLRAVMRTYTALSGSHTPSRLSQHFECDFVPEIKRMHDLCGHSIGSGANHLITTAGWMKPETANMYPGIHTGGTSLGTPNLTAGEVDTSSTSAASSAHGAGPTWVHSHFLMYKGPVRVQYGTCPKWGVPTQQADLPYFPLHVAWFTDPENAHVGTPWPKGLQGLFHEPPDAGGAPPPPVEAPPVHTRSGRLSKRPALRD